MPLTDALSNFDASQSAWAQANAASLAANPNANPDVFVVVPFVSPQYPLDTTLAAYAPLGAALTTAGTLRRTAESTSAAAPELPAVGLYPRGLAMFDNEARTYTLVGSDTDGGYVGQRGRPDHPVEHGIAGT